MTVTGMTFVALIANIYMLLKIFRARIPNLEIHTTSKYKIFDCVNGKVDIILYCHV